MATITPVTTPVATLAPLLTPREVAQQFHKNKIVELKETELSSGKRSPYYMDTRGLLAFPNLMNDVIEKLNDRISATTPEFDKLASVPVGAVPFASMLAARMNKASVLVRDQPKQHGTKRLIEGRLGIDDRVILVEDVITTGASVIKTIQKLKNRGAEVVAVWALLNREEGGSEHITYEYKDIPVYSLFTTSDIFTQLVKDKSVSAYDWERIKFFQEAQYKDMIRTLREKNATKQAPEWETNRALYFASRFPHWIALQSQTPSNLILSLENPINLTATQITHILAKNRVPVPLIHTSCKNISPANLEQWNRETGGRVIYDSSVVLGWETNSSCGTFDKINPVSQNNDGTETTVRYEVAANHILISSVADIDSAIVTLQKHNEKYIECGNRNKFIVLEFNKLAVKDLVNDDTIWQALERLVAATTGNNLNCCGLAFKYSDVRHMTGRRDLWKRAPVVLWVDDWHLHPSMVSEAGGVMPDFHKSYAEMNFTMERLHPWQIVMDSDAISATYPVIERIGQYAQFFKSNQLTNLITEIRCKIYTTELVTKEPSDANPNPCEADILNVMNYYKSACKDLTRVRESVPQQINHAAGKRTTSKSNSNSNSTLLKRTTANELCNDIYIYCRQGIEWVYLQISDINEARKIAAEKRAKTQPDKKLN